MRHAVCAAPFLNALSCRQFACALFCLSLAQPAIADSAGVEEREVKIRPAEVRHARELLSNYPVGARLELPGLSREEERKIIGLMEDKSRFYVSISRPVKVGETNWRRVGEKEGNSVWQLHVRSPGALGVRVWFSGFDLAPGTSVKVYGADTGTATVEEYTGRGWMDTVDFWSLSVRGDTAVVEFWVPSSPGASLEPADFPFRISALDHRFRDNAGDIPRLKYHSVAVPRSHTDCLNPQNERCFSPDGVPRWKSVARIYSPPAPGRSGFSCTAGAVNARGTNTEGVYLLTAWHCVWASSEAAKGTPLNFDIYIGFSDCAPKNQRIRGQGAQFIASHPRGDYALIWVNASDLTSQEESSVLPLDWTTRTLSVGSSIETYSHPEGREKQHYGKVRITAVSHLVWFGHHYDWFEVCSDPARCSHYYFEEEVRGFAGGSSGAALWLRESSVARIAGVLTHSQVDNDIRNNFCYGWASRMTKIYEDGRVRCALEHGDAYHPENSASCDDTARPAYYEDAATLSVLALSGVNFGAFSSATTRYTASVAHGVAVTTVTAAVPYARAALEITPSDADVGTEGHQVNLDVGETTVAVTVTAGDLSATRVYTVTVTRRATSDDATLSVLSLSGIDIGAFTGETTVYAANVGHDVESMTVTAMASDQAGIRISPPDAEPDVEGHQVNLVVGDTVIEVMVTARDGNTTRTYTVTITRAKAPAWGTRLPERDLPVGDVVAVGLWSNGRTMWVAPWEGDELIAYRLADGARLPGQDVAGLSALNPSGMWSNSATMWVSDFDGSRIYAHRLSDGAPLPGQDFDTLVNAGNGEPTGIWSNGRTLWVADFYGRKLFAYRSSDKQREKDAEILLNLRPQARWVRPFGVWLGKETLLVANWNGGTVVAYRLPDDGAPLSDVARLPALDIDTTATGNRWPLGLWSDGEILWVADEQDGKLYAYAVPGLKRYGAPD